MKKLLIKGALALSTLLLSAAPAFSSTITLSFTFDSLNYGTYSTNSSGFLTAATLQVSSVSVLGGGSSLTGTAGQDNYTLFLASANGQATDTETWDLYSGNATSGTALLAFTAQTTLTGTGSSKQETFSTTFGSVTSVSGTLATDGITVGSDAFPLAGSLITAANGIATSATNAAVSSADLGLVTPEPASLAMLGSGLVGIALLRRRSKMTSL